MKSINTFESKSESENRFSKEYINELLEDIYRENFNKNSFHRIVLFLDIMGFKDRLRRTDLKDLNATLLVFKKRTSKLKPLLNGKNKRLLNMVQFSDSILLVSEKDTLDDLNRITKAAVILMQTAFELGIAMRGAVAVGNMVFDEENQLYFGQALVDAYLLEEELNCYGVVFHSTAEKLVRKALTPIKSRMKSYFPICNDELKFKGGASKHYHIAWYKMEDDLSEGDISKKALSWLENLRETVSGGTRVYLDNTRKLIEERNKTGCEKALPENQKAVLLK